VFPIVGGRTVDHLRGNIEALGLVLTHEEINELEDVAPFDLGFPMNMFVIGKPRDVSGQPTAIDTLGNAMYVRLDEPALVQPTPADHKVIEKTPPGLRQPVEQVDSKKASRKDKL
jgi:hypothetical protein